MTSAIRVLLTLATCLAACMSGRPSSASDDLARPSKRQGESFLARFIADEERGYRARPCGFDMDRNGVIGEPADRLVGDGKTGDPDGDGGEEDILYVDSETGSDAAGDGSSRSPFATIQKALDAADGNVFDPDAGFRWNNRKHWQSLTFAQWRDATGQDANSKTAAPTFADAAAGDLHLTSEGKTPGRSGVDIRGITGVDFDGDPRSQSRPVAGANVPSGRDGSR